MIKPAIVIGIILATIILAILKIKNSKEVSCFSDFTGFFLLYFICIFLGFTISLIIGTFITDDSYYARTLVETIPIESYDKEGFSIGLGHFENKSVYIYKTKTDNEENISRLQASNTSIKRGEKPAIEVYEYKFRNELYGYIAAKLKQNDYTITIPENGKIQEVNSIIK